MPKIDPDMESFQADLLEAVRDMKANLASRKTEVQLPAAANARAHTGLSQTQFAQLLGVPSARSKTASKAAPSPREPRRR